MKKLLMTFSFLALSTAALSSGTGKAISSNIVKKIKTKTIDRKITHKVNIKSSHVVWTGSKKVGGSHTGKLKLEEGSLIYNGMDLVGGSFTVDMTSMTSTDLEGKKAESLIGHLKNDDFFSVDKFPKARFVITDVRTEKGGNLGLRGDLTIKGITHPATIKTTFKEVNKTKVQAFGALNFNRAKYAVKYNSASFFDIEKLKDKVINDDIKLDIYLTINL